MVALSPLVHSDMLEKVLAQYPQLYTQRYLYLMGQKLGLEQVTQEKDLALFTHLLGMLQGLTIDYTLFFRTLSHYDGDREKLLKIGLYHKPMNDWLDSYDERLKANTISTEKRLISMRKKNPKYVLKNYILQEAIDLAEKGDFSIVNDLFKIAQNPYDEHEAFERWAGVTPDTFKNQKLSCSS
jgi:uncharacterized protein YdiU (UPF0061 family)